LRQLVEHARVRIAGDGVEIVVELLDVLAVIAFFVGQPEQPFLQDRIAAVPEGDRQAEELPVVAETGDAVLAPAIGAAARLVVREIIPRRAAGAVVLAHRAPLPLAHIRAPAPPILLTGAALLETSPFGVNGHR
jgi:hypothetical protein